MDMLVKLYELPPFQPQIDRLTEQNIELRRALAYEKDSVLNWVEEHFDAGWRSECDVAFSHMPIGCWIATREKEILGFGCYDVTAKGFFGPTGVSEAARGLGIGKALLIACLWSLRHEGHAYGIIGGVGPAEFYNKVVGATLIEGSEQGIYR